MTRPVIPEPNFDGVVTPDCDERIRLLNNERIRLRKWLVEIMELARENEITLAQAIEMCTWALASGETPASVNQLRDG